MNDTNRALNRILLLIVGVAALAASAVAVLLLTVPSAGRSWAGTAHCFVTAADNAFGSPLWPGLPPAPPPGAPREPGPTPGSEPFIVANPAQMQPTPLPPVPLPREAAPSP